MAKPRKEQVAKLLSAARQHDVLCEATGWRATESTDTARAEYERIRAESTPEERGQFEAVYF